MWLVSGLLKDELLLWHPHVYVPWVSPKPHVSCLLKIFPDKAKTRLWTSALHSRCTNRSPHCPQSEPLPRKVVRNKVAKKLLVLWIKNLPPSKVSIRKTHRALGRRSSRQNSWICFQPRSDSKYPDLGCWDWDCFSLGASSEWVCTPHSFLSSPTCLMWVASKVFYSLRGFYDRQERAQRKE